MNDLIAKKIDRSMTTVEIAELTGKRHDNVLRDARVMLIELYGEKDLLRFGQTYIDGQNRKYPCYRLPKKEVMVLVSGYSIKLRMKIITRLEELEKKAEDPMMVLSDPTALRNALLTYSEKVLPLEQTVNVQTQKVAEDLEKRLPQLSDFSNPAIAARAWADEIEKNMLLEKTVNVQAPKVAAHKP